MLSLLKFLLIVIFTLSSSLRRVRSCSTCTTFLPSFSSVDASHSYYWYSFILLLLTHLMVLLATYVVAVNFFISISSAITIAKVKERNILWVKSVCFSRYIVDWVWGPLEISFTAESENIWKSSLLLSLRISQNFNLYWVCGFLETFFYWVWKTLKF